MKRILCFGDSNTYGYISGSDHKRFEQNERWTGLLKQELGANYEIIEEGLNSRTITSNDPRIGREGRSGVEYLLPCLDSHDPLDLVIVMLGTNEVKVRYDKSSDEICVMLEKSIINPIRTRKLYNGGNPQIIIITPPKVNGILASNNFEKKYDITSEEKSIQLEKKYKQLAKKLGCFYVSALDLPTGIDGVHFTKESHRILANRLTNTITEIFK